MNKKKFKTKSLNKKYGAQVSLEYLLILAAFFSVFSIILSSVLFAMDSFNSAQDTILAKQISEKISEQVKMFSYLGNGSKKEFEFLPINKITIYSEGTKIIISSEQKSFEIETQFQQKIPNTIFSEKFKIILEKNNNKTKVSTITK